MNMTRLEVSVKEEYNSWEEFWLEEYNRLISFHEENDPPTCYPDMSIKESIVHAWKQYKAYNTLAECGRTMEKWPKGQD